MFNTPKVCKICPEQKSCNKIMNSSCAEKREIARKKLINLGTPVKFSKELERKLTGGVR